MIVPQYWAESRIQERRNGKQVTVRRFGWSDISPGDAQVNADDRARQALEKIISGVPLARRERKVPYNGAEGVPIREEILSRHGEAVVTRNIYGAHCLNTPDVLFADIDFHHAPTTRLTCTMMGVMLICALLLGFALHSLGIAVFTGIAGLWLSNALANFLYNLQLQRTGGIEQASINRVKSFMADRPEWHARLYRTPAGLRVLALHQTFDPTEPAVAEFFQAIGVDTLYARMCLNQRCFRARVSPKPWRIGIAAHIVPRPGVWPVKPERLPERNRWIDAYEQAARGYASCRFIEALGNGAVHPSAEMVLGLHDELCRATNDLPIA